MALAGWAGAGAGVDERFEMNSLGVLPVQDDRTAPQGRQTGEPAGHRAGAR